MLNPIIAERRREREALTIEIFASTYGCDWPEARRIALAELPALLDYAREWDTTQAADAAIVSTAWAVGCLK
jgi:hypothetical protein